MAVVQKSRTENQVLFFQHHNATHDSVLSLDPSLLICPRSGTAAEVQPFLTKYKPVVMQIPAELASGALVDQMKKAGCSVWINSLGKKDDLAEVGRLADAFFPLVKAGATIIQTDRPDLLLSYLNKIKRRW